MNPLPKKVSPAKKQVSPAAPILYSELAASERLGISLDSVRMIRKTHLTSVKDYFRDGLSVQIRECGMEKLETLLGEQPGSSRDSGSPRLAALVVERSNIQNTGILMAKEPGSEVVVRVRVRSNVNWMRGMLISPCREVSATLFHYEGRQPRFRGKM